MKFPIKDFFSQCEENLPAFLCSATLKIFSLPTYLPFQYCYVCYLTDCRIQLLKKIFFWETFFILVQSSLVFREQTSNKTRLKKSNDRKFDITHCIKWFEIHDGINNLQNPLVYDAKMEWWIMLWWKCRTLDRVSV